MPDYQSENQADRLSCYSSKRALWLYQQYRLWGYALFELHFVLHVHQLLRHCYRSPCHSVKGKALHGDNVTLTHGLELCPSSTFSF